MRFYPYYRSFCRLTVSSALLFPLLGVTAETSPSISAQQFLNNIGSAPKAATIYSFLNLYQNKFSDCQEIDAYLQALDFLLKNGDESLVQLKLASIDRCKNLSTAQKNKIARLKSNVVPKNTDNTRTNDSTPRIEVTDEMTFAPHVNPTQTDTNKKNLSVAKTQNIPAPHPTPHKTLSTPNTTKAISKQLALTADPATSKSPTDATFTKVKPSLVERPERTPLDESPNAIAALASPAQATKDVITSVLSSKNNWRNGNSGTSRLRRNENDLIVSDGSWSFSAGEVKLNSGSYAGQIAVGSSPTSAPKNTLTTQATVFEPKLSYANGNTTISIGTTPLGGEASPLPTFRWLWHEKQGGISLFHESVNDSLLSTIGFKDIYSDKTMGRVIKTGLTGNWNYELSDNWFYGGTITGAYLYGDNVKQNAAIKADSYIGKAIGGFSLGLYSSVDHFVRDQNHFTLGHGGYYSPQLAANLSVFSSYKLSNEISAFSVDVSIGLSHEKTKDVPMYYFLNAGNSPIYTGEQRMKVPVNIGFAVQHKLSSKLVFNVDGRLLNSGSYTEAKLAANIGYAF